MKRLALLLLLLASPAWGVPRYWVSPNGTNTTWADSGVVKVGANAKSLAWVNANAQPGHIYILTAGDYGTIPIAPADNRNGTASNRIRYYGNMAHPESVQVAGVELGPYQWSYIPRTSANSGQYTTVRWVTSKNSVRGFGYFYQYVALRDSIVRVICTNQSETLAFGGSDCVMDSCSLSGTTTGSSVQNDQMNWFYFGGHSVDFQTSHRDTVLNSTFNCTVNQPLVSGVFRDFDLMKSDYATYHVIDNCTFNVNVVEATGYCLGGEWYFGGHNTIKNCTYNWNVNGPLLGTSGMWSSRSGSSFNRYINNTVNLTSGPLASGNGMCLRLTNAGNTGTDWTDVSNYYGYNRIHNTGRLLGTLLLYYDGATGDTLEFNTFSTTTTDPILSTKAGDPLNSNVIHHNTFYTAGSVAINLTGGTGTIGRFASNIYYGGSANGSGSETIRVSAGCDIDSAGVFYSVGGTAARAISKGGVASAPPGGASLYANPLFLNAPSNLHLQTGSPALTGGTPWDGYAGAYGPDGATAHYTITAGAALAGYGSVEPSSASVEEGGSRTFSVVPLAGYHVTDVLVDGSSVGAVTSYQFTNVTATHTIQAAFGINTYSIYAYAGAGGTINPSGIASVDYGETPVYAITPSSGYRLAALAIDDEILDGWNHPEYTFTPIDAPHTLEAFFVPEDSVAVVAVASGGGSISPAGVANYLPGVDTPEYTIAPYDGWSASGFLIDGVAQAGTPDGDNLVYTFSPLASPPEGQSAHSVEGVFLADSVSIIATATDNGIISSAGVTRLVSGASKSFSVVPTAFYSLSDVLVDGVSVGPRAWYTFTNATVNHTIEAQFTTEARHGGSSWRRRHR